ncbi:hypothetical protein HOP50_07g48750 [Chloropicon primus]|nr:hypothetical protein A3770_07p48550 [Chloropicon primus]UPR01553.1 hypothetical protein HOP50_07g48750 [Chloropicon primus]|eukprot:QDZ22337.1 hypothetical protein A3770_07p48550 [Chloropicon primus]
MKASASVVAASVLLAVMATTSCSAATGVQFMKVLPQPGSGQTEAIILRNVGSEPVDLTGWSIVDKSKRAMNSFWFGGDSATMAPQPVKWCSNWTSIEPDQEFTLRPFNRDRFSASFDPCGFRFSLGFDGQLELRNADKQPVDIVSWTKAKDGMAIYRMGSKFIPFMEDSDMKSSIKAAPVLSIFAKALHSTNILDKYLKEGASIKIDKDSWMAKHLARKGYEKTYYKGPWTVFAPSNEAFLEFMKEMGWMGMTLTEDELLAMPELEDILLYHIVMGQEWSSGIKNATGVLSMKDGAEVAVFHGKNGEFLVHDDCVDRPSPDNYGCEMQAEWKKCNEDWVQDDGLFSGRTLGYCERSCNRCTCEGDQCGRASVYDIPASNGVLHVIDKVLYPAPVYEKPAAQWRSKAEMEAEMNGGSAGNLKGFLNGQQ